jgi:hypothetical protein
MFIIIWSNSRQLDLFASYSKVNLCIFWLNLQRWNLCTGKIYNLLFFCRWPEVYQPLRNVFYISVGLSQICLRVKVLIIKGYYIQLMRDWSSHNSSQQTNCLLQPKQKCPCNARLNETDYFFSANLTIILNHQLSKWVWRNMLMRIYGWEVLATTRIYIYIWENRYKTAYIACFDMKSFDCLLCKTCVV